MNIRGLSVLAALMAVVGKNIKPHHRAAAKAWLDRFALAPNFATNAFSSATRSSAPTTGAWCTGTSSPTTCS